MSFRRGRLCRGFTGPVVLTAVDRLRYAVRGFLENIIQSPIRKGKRWKFLELPKIVRDLCGTRYYTKNNFVNSFMGGGDG